MKFLNDIIQVLFWILVTCVFINMSMPINDFLETKVAITRLLYILIVLFGFVVGYTKIEPLISRWEKTINILGFQSSPSINFLIGLYSSFVFIKIFFKEIANIISTHCLGLLIISSLIGILFYRVYSQKPPTTSPEHRDILKREVFINKVLSLLNNPHDLVSRQPEEALIVWITSQWGTGKTWTLENIKKRFLSSNNQKNTVWYSFNPWLHSSPQPETDLIKIFFNGLSEELNRHFHLEALNKKILSYMNSIIAHVGKKTLGVNLPLAQDGSTTTEVLKENVSQYLLSYNINLVITFDEVDRLVPKEITTCLRLIRSMSNFSNTTIIVCAASDKIEELLDRANLPKDYLEKIAQVPLNLPLISTNQIFELLWFYSNAESLSKTKQDLLRDSIDELKPRKYSYSYAEGNSYHLLNNLRTIQRLADAIKDFFTEEKHQEINCTDYISLQLIRLNHFRLYESIKAHKRMWTSSSSQDFSERVELNSFQKEQKRLVDDILSTSSSDNALREVIALLFPSYAYIYSKTCSENTIQHRNREGDNHISIPEYFDRYFVEGMPEGQVSNQNISKIISLLDEGKDLEKALRNYNDKDTAWIFRELSTNFKDQLSTKTTIKILKYLIKEKIYQCKEYATDFYVASPENFELDIVEGYMEIIEYCFSQKNNEIQYAHEIINLINAVYWDHMRSESHTLSKTDIATLTNEVCDQFTKSFLSKVNLLELNDSDLHFFWGVLTRWQPKLNNRFRNNIEKDITNHVDSFYRYINVYRQFPPDRPRAINSYVRETLKDCMSPENIQLAKSHLAKGKLTGTNQVFLEEYLKTAKNEKLDGTIEALQN